MDKVEIYVATLVSFDRVGSQKFDESGKNIISKTLEFTTIKTMDCVIDEERGNAIDLETGEVYHIMKRDHLGNLNKEEGEKLKKSPSGVLFVYQYYKKDMRKISLIYRVFMTDRAQRKFAEYLDNINQNEQVKTKTKQYNK